MAHTDLQNAAKCIHRANAEILQAARSCRDAGESAMADAMEKWAEVIGPHGVKIETMAGGPGGPPLKKKGKSSPSNEDLTPPETLIA